MKNYKKYIINKNEFLLLDIKNYYNNSIEIDFLRNKYIKIIINEDLDNKDLIFNNDNNDELILKYKKHFNINQKKIIKKFNLEKSLLTNIPKVFLTSIDNKYISLTVSYDSFKEELKPNAKIINLEIKDFIFYFIKFIKNNKYLIDSKIFNQRFLVSLYSSLYENYSLDLSYYYIEKFNNYFNLLSSIDNITFGALYNSYHMKQFGSIGSFKMIIPLRGKFILNLLFLDNNKFIIDKIIDYYKKTFYYINNKELEIIILTFDPIDKNSKKYKDFFNKKMFIVENNNIFFKNINKQYEYFETLIL